MRRAARRTAAQLTPRAVWRDHRLFALALAIGLVPRVLALLAFRPALLTADSFLYMQGATQHVLGTIRPSGYSLFLVVMRLVDDPLLAVTIAQHLMGLAIAVIVYALLRTRGLPGWGATLAALPVLLDVREVALESYILPDTLFCLVLLIVVALALTRSTPRPWQCAVAGLGMAYVTVLRGNGLPLAVIVAAALLIRRVGWRAIAAGAVAFAAPVGLYVLAFHSAYGQFNLTSSDGLFLWSRTTSFANCKVIKPPASLRPLCPSSEPQFRPPARPAPAFDVSALLDGPTPADYLWAGNVWWRHDAHPGINAYNNRLGERFAVAAIKAQPLAYLRVAAANVLLTFAATDRPQSHETMTFTTTPHIAALPAYYARDEQRYAGTTANTHPVNPYAYFLFGYQQPVYFPGLVFAAVVVAGLIGVARRWRQWGGPAALPWALAAVSIVSPALLTQSLYRYVMVAIPLSCLAAGLMFARPAAGRAAAQVALAEPPGQDLPSQDLPAQDALTQDPAQVRGPFEAARPRSARSAAGPEHAPFDESRSGSGTSTPDTTRQDTTAPEAAGPG